MNLWLFDHNATDCSKSEREQSSRWRTLKLGYHLLVGSGSVLAQIGRVCDDYHDANVRKLKVRN